MKSFRLKTGIHLHDVPSATDLEGNELGKPGEERRVIPAGLTVKLDENSDNVKRLLGKGAIVSIGGRPPATPAKNG
ncbi:MAG: hypothetical protein V3V49_15195 [Candidatus Krumholzibacteria bacterium]